MNKAIGIIREEKSPEDNRVPLTPTQCRKLQSQFDIPIHIQSSSHRCFSDDEYAEEGVQVVEDLSQCRMLLGVKEVPLERLIDNQVYFFFSHTIKAQSYNRELLRTILEKNIRLIDWECLTNTNGQRLIAFGRWAGIVGAHNALYMWAKRSAAFKLDRAVELGSLAALKERYLDLKLPPIKICVTGKGRVSQGVMEILDAAKIRRVHQAEYLTQEFDEAVYCVLDSPDLYLRKADGGYLESEFFTKGDLYESKFLPFAAKTDLMINGIYWDPKAPAFFSLDEMCSPHFRIKAIADITCDIAPESSVPSTLRPSTIDNPIYGFDPQSGKELEPFSQNAIDVMAIDNLPNELPRDASTAFGEMFLEHILPEALKPEKSEMLWRATVAVDGALNHPYNYLQDFVNGK